MDTRRGQGRSAPQESVSSDLPITANLIIPGAELRWRFSRASGPGGQGVNTTDSRVELTVNLLGLDALSPEQFARVADALGARLVDGALTLVASEHRSQLRNREAARGRLTALLQSALAAPPKQRKATKATRGSRRRRLEAKKQRSQTKDLRRRPEH
ncbi:alternative ribosome rescue aminoacyl-tRNA hydrolase ArfB [Tomitella biformata]|uniref:alternative ribosome rescue aminoacyl-tRNA hydrolase ArfB n=1 Tax=Tomitella biformata TaxID=630403 RepID=UPI000466A119|nr:alternative ribosome rescue aminoacyl-tRNA hydrolase ArfB [Tomitella biformata]